jgi:hypothetical protein
VVARTGLPLVWKCCGEPPLQYRALELRKGRAYVPTIYNETIVREWDSTKDEVLPYCNVGTVSGSSADGTILHRLEQRQVTLPMMHVLVQISSDTISESR